MSDALEILTGYGALGCWVVFSIIRERILMAKIDQLTLRFESERMRWDRERVRWLKTLGRKLSDRTIDESIMVRGEKFDQPNDEAIKYH